MYTVDTALESLKKYDISESDLLCWEDDLELEIPVDEYGRKLYSPHHINLFKNIKKHIALGRTIDEIRQIISLPPLTDSRPKGKAAHASVSAASTPPSMQSMQQVLAEAQHNVSGAAQQPVAPPPKMMPPQQQPAPRLQEIAQPKPQAREMPEPAAARPAPAKVITKSPYASLPKRPATGGSGADGNGAANVVNLVQRLTREKDQLYKKLLETEKLNSHLYSANSLFHKKVKEMTTQIQKLRESLHENERFKLLDDKAKLHKQLIAAERLAQQKDEQIQNRKQEADKLRQEIRQLESRIGTMIEDFEPSSFQGDWIESGHLVEVAYDNFGINIDPERVRLFRISEPPQRLYGQTAVITTSYQYETNNLWKRNETLMVSYIDADTLEGELIADYILDGVPVAQALYRVSCKRNQ
ncbi:MAG TPA: MerR family transcriptional regulator [Coleofasciculaceae cyanobacterium]